MLGGDRRAPRRRRPLGRAGGRRQRSSSATSSSASRASRIRRRARSTRGYNLEQSKTTVGSGQFRGRGPNGSTQVKLGFLPEHGTDFVFASFAEQRGFVGAVILLGLYLLVLWRGLRVVTVARDLFSAIVAGGIVVALLFQIFVNVGMTMGIAPITGIPLAVRERRRLVADREPRGDGRAARDPRARPRSRLLAPPLMLTLPISARGPPQAC